MTDAPLVLVVDDEPDIRDLIALNLASSGYRIQKAGTAREALEAATRTQPSVIVLDVMMPESDGFDVLRVLKADPVLAPVPVVIVSALGAAEARIRGGIEGALRYVTKPFTRRALLDAVEAVIDGHGPPESDARRAVRAASLAELARLEAGTSFDRGPTRAVVRPARLERAPAPRISAREVGALRGRLERLEPAQLDSLRVLRDCDSPTDAAEYLGLSRTSYYAMLRRVVGTLGLDGTPALQAALRAGLLDG